MTSVSSTLIGEQAMVDFGAKLAVACSGGALVYFVGDLGMGKTTLCRGVLQALGHRGPVKSPTYTLVEPYELAEITVYHFDLYRLSSPEELEYMGIRDYFSKGSLCLVEWPGKGAGVLPPADIEVRIEAINKGRKLTLQGHTPGGQVILERLQNLPG